MLPNTTPTRLAIELARPRVAPRLSRGMKRQVKDRVQPLEERRIDVEPRRVEPRHVDESAAGRVDVVGDGDPRIEGLGRIDQPSAGGNLAGGVDTVADVDPELLERLERRGTGPRCPRSRSRRLVPCLIHRHHSARENRNTRDQLVAAECLVERRVDDTFVGIEPRDQLAPRVEKLDVGHGARVARMLGSRPGPARPRPGMRGGTDDSDPRPSAASSHPSRSRHQSTTSWKAQSMARGSVSHVFRNGRSIHSDGDGAVATQPAIALAAPLDLLDPLQSPGRGTRIV